jgi:hypothetical protein
VETAEVQAARVYLPIKRQRDHLPLPIHLQVEVLEGHEAVVVHHQVHLVVADHAVVAVEVIKFLNS